METINRYCFIEQHNGARYVINGPIVSAHGAVYDTTSTPGHAQWLAEIVAEYRATVDHVTLAQSINDMLLEAQFVVYCEHAGAYLTPQAYEDAADEAAYIRDHEHGLRCDHHSRRFTL